MALHKTPLQVTSRKPFLIGVAGGSASGKSSVCNKIVEQLGQDAIDFKQRQVSILSQESFYRELSPDEAENARDGTFNFDHPDAFDNQLVYKSLSKLKEGEPAKIPVYDVKSSSRTQEMTVMYPTDVILFEGILVLYQKEIRDMLDMKLFVDTDSDTRLSRRVLRDIEERGRDLDKILASYTTFVKPAFEEFCLPTKKYADVIIPRGSDNIVAINLIGQHIKDILSGKKVRSSKPSQLPESPTEKSPSRGRERKPSESSRSRPH